MGLQHAAFGIAYHCNRLCFQRAGRLFPVPPGRCRFLPGKLAVRGLPGAKRRDAKAAGHSALDRELSRRQDRPVREDGPVALVGVVNWDA